MAKTFKVLSALLCYPTEELQAAVGELAATLNAESLLGVHQRRPLGVLLRQLKNRPLLELQERYVFLFDRTRSLSLQLFEHIHGESRDRGQAMVDLLELYRRHGLELDARELPDYLPLFLEFLSTRPLDEARELLAQPLHILVALGKRLGRRKSPYAAVFEALARLTETDPAPADLQSLLDLPEDDPQDFQSLDQIWEEEAVLFGPGSADGVRCEQAAKALNRMGAGINSSPTGGVTGE